MRIGHWHKLGIPTCLLAMGFWQSTAFEQKAPQPKVDFAKEVLPVLKAHCFQCHSGAQTSGGLRLDTRAVALKGGVSGTSLLPGSGAKSLLVTRLTDHGGKPRMPLGFAPLTEAQITTLRNWIDQGAVWPEATTWPGSIRVAVTTPRVSASSVA